MYELLSTSMKRIAQSDHLDRLLENDVFDVYVKSEEGGFLIHFENNNIQFQQIHEDHCDIDCKIVIEGDMEALRLLFNGDDFLLSMKKRGDIKVQGSLKQLLLLESILYLSKTEVKNG